MGIWQAQSINHTSLVPIWRCFKLKTHQQSYDEMMCGSLWSQAVCNKILILLQARHPHHSYPSVSRCHGFATAGILAQVSAHYEDELEMYMPHLKHTTINNNTAYPSPASNQCTPFIAPPLSFSVLLTFPCQFPILLSLFSTHQGHSYYCRDRSGNCLLRGL